MDPLPVSGLALAAGYLLGSIPFAWIAVKARTGQDLRTVGSGNAGATNASRVLGKAWFLPLFLLDAGKGAGAVAIAPLLDGGPWTPVAAAAGAVLGHILCPWLGFKGGKAVATGAGALSILSPWSALAGLGGFAVAAGISRFVSLGSVVAAAAVAAASWTFAGDGTPVRTFATLLAVVVIARHLSNLRRIAAGTEPKIGEPK
jgi:glycerol-3-phosphate acyltransferase PlsY